MYPDAERTDDCWPDVRLGNPAAAVQWPDIRREPARSPDSPAGTGTVVGTLQIV